MSFTEYFRAVLITFKQHQQETYTPTFKTSGNFISHLSWCLCCEGSSVQPGYHFLIWFFLHYLINSINQLVVSHALSQCTFAQKIQRGFTVQMNNTGLKLVSFRHCGQQDWKDSKMSAIKVQSQGCPVELYYYLRPNMALELP